MVARRASAQGGGAPGFHERRPVSPGLIWAGAGVLGVTAALGLIVHGLAVREVATMLGLLVVVMGPFALFAVSPWGWELKHVTVTDEGLWLRDRLLPAGRVGRVEVLGQGKAAAMYSFARRRHGLRRHPRRSSANSLWMRKDDAPVLVEDTASGRAWLVATRRPDELVAALEGVRPPRPDGPSGGHPGQGDPRAGWSGGVRVVSPRHTHEHPSGGQDGDARSDGR